MESNLTEPQLPRGIAAELETAAQRTGWTTALQIAAARLPRLLRMTPAEFERMAGRLYNELTTV